MLSAQAPFRSTPAFLSTVTSTAAAAGVGAILTISFALGADAALASAATINQASAFHQTGGPAVSALTVAEGPSILAAAPGLPLSSQITDSNGSLTDAEKQKITKAISTLQSQKGLKVYVVFMDDFGSVDPATWTKNAQQKTGDQSACVLAVATKQGEYQIYGGNKWSNAELDAMNSAVYAPLHARSFGDAAYTAVTSATSATAGSGRSSGGSGSSGGAGSASSGDGAVWLGAGGVAVVAAGGGVWAYGRRKKKQDQSKALAGARQLEPDNVRAIVSLPLNTLKKRAQEIIIETDESVRGAQEEYGIAEGEFGPERTRAFLRALNEANAALNNAHHTQALLSDSIPETEQQQRSMYTDIVSSCGTAQKALEEQSKHFQDLRTELIQASSTLDKLTQKAVDLRARVEPAAATLDTLRSKYEASTLASINDNPTMARVAIEESEKSLDAARELAAKPAGQQGGLVDAIREAERAQTLANDLIEGIEHAETNIAHATSTLPALINEVTEEIAESARIKERGTAHNAQVDWSVLDSAVASAREALQKADAAKTTDPLSAYSVLTHADSVLDEAMATATEGTQTQERALALLDRQITEASSRIQGAEDFIASRGRIIGQEARTQIAEAQRLLAQAQNNRLRDTRNAMECARSASSAAGRAASAAQGDVDRYHSRQAAQVGGDVINGLIIGSLLSGGGRGGFGGGFGGGGFNGGFGGHGGFGGGGGFDGGGGRGGSF